jgi:hypothetical protein
VERPAAPICAVEHSRIARLVTGGSMTRIVDRLFSAVLAVSISGVLFSSVLY